VAVLGRAAVLAVLAVAVLGSAAVVLAVLAVAVLGSAAVVLAVRAMAMFGRAMMLVTIPALLVMQQRPAGLALCAQRRPALVAAHRVPQGQVPILVSA